jgi:predicted nucleotidyltransferase
VDDWVRTRLGAVEALCRELHVRRLDVFGSAAKGSFGADSDVDVLVEFDGRGDPDLFGDYFALREGLERIFERPVDVVVASSVRNPYFRAEVMRTRELLYAA